MTVEQLDREPRTDAEREEKLYIVALQAGELADVDNMVTCPCGHRFAFALTGYRCLECGLIFCRACALRHFA